jgi:hypothetical protein
VLRLDFITINAARTQKVPNVRTRAT